MRPVNLDVGVYVHFPFCLRRCMYCDFATRAVDARDIPHERYADVVLKEARKRLSLVDARIRLTSVFVGGGTPSLWAPASMGRVVAGIIELFPERVAPLEVTVEANPCTLDGPRASELVEQGVTRLSVGVQSTDDGRLRMLGRLHDGRAGISALQVARRSGVRVVSADFMHGLPGQAAHEAVHDVQRIVDEGVDHLSAYLLSLERGTALTAQVERGIVPEIDEGEAASSYLAVSDALVAAGFEHYEVSNFARAGFGCEHNSRVWRGEAYLGLGASAVGCMPVRGVGVVRTRNKVSLAAYERAVGELDAAALVCARGVEDMEVLDGETRMRERIMLGLRTSSGVDLEEAERELGVAGWRADRRREARRLERAGRVVVNGTRIFIPRRQWVWESDTVSRLL